MFKIFFLNCVIYCFKRIFILFEVLLSICDKINHSANMQSAPPPEGGCEINIDFCLNMVCNIDTNLNKRLKKWMINKSF